MVSYLGEWNILFQWIIFSAFLYLFMEVFSSHHAVHEDWGFLSFNWLASYLHHLECGPANQHQPFKIE